MSINPDSVNPLTFSGRKPGTLSEGGTTRAEGEEELVFLLVRGGVTLETLNKQIDEIGSFLEKTPIYDTIWFPAELLKELNNKRLMEKVTGKISDALGPTFNYIFEGANEGYPNLEMVLRILAKRRLDSTLSLRLKKK